MGYALPADLSFCLTGGRVIFLNLAQDRYFRLGAGADAAFQTLLSSGHASEEDIEALVRLGVIRPTTDGGGLIPAMVMAPSRSVLETEPPGRRPGIWMTLQVLDAVARSWRALKLTPIARVLQRLRRTRARALDRSGKVQIEARADDVLAVAVRFNRARRAVPINTVCLLDSLALVDFLARRGMCADLIIGVKLNPFVAHSWVQHRDVILNDPLDRASAFTPILVV